MVQLNGFDASQIEPRVEFEPLPEGQYLAMIIASEQKQSKSGGEYVELTMEIQDGKHKGRRVWDRLNLHHSKPEVVEIAMRTLSAICRAVGVLTPNDTAELHNIPLTIKVKCETRKDNGEITNRVSGYSSRDEVVEQRSAAPTGAAPWAR